ncbi:hypothetical protein ACFFF5_03035 [Lederbergia wuyishanensis]|uniref:Glycerophosphoryl diester phosphodiesterase membrane domain-containing protein n=1 Tax=Lederbergia wuyishanensis TaxID=1347903 RepID=A0ABU0D096_9BACI|nr:hypothetical protein [Lederbergia wuyishanensis]MCJ8006443.1 hypothetical protein [Lederbergia wuyishanensis]MDQ0341818.1 hypothetical protein [Lederbergia wuyishanensis]
MEIKFNRPKGFGEILDLTFRLSKYKFSDFLLINLIFMGPIYLLQVFIQLISGVSFFRELGSGDVWYEQILSSFEDTGTASLGADLSIIAVSFLSIFLFPVASAAILIAINHMRKSEKYTVGTVIKEAFSRYGPILGSSILFVLLVIGLVFIPIIIVVLVGVVGSLANPIVGILMAILLFIGFAIGIGLLLTRWSFYFGSVVLDDEVLGFSRSRKLSKKRTWALFGLYIVFSLIVSSISYAVEVSFGIFLGNSVLLSIISGVVSLFTTMIFSVGYAVMYLDAKTRHDADDLKEMIEDYNAVQS